MTPAQEYVVAGGVVLVAGIAVYAVHVTRLVRSWWAGVNATADRILDTLDDHAAQALRLANVVRCGECTDPLDDINRAPGCLAHDTCLACAPTPYCDECTRELDHAGLLEHPIPFTLSEQAWEWGR